MNAKFYIEKLGLIAHPEGGYFKETYRSSIIIEQSALPEKFESERNIATQIYFLLESKNFSAFHKLKSDETWHFYDGNPVYVYLIFPDGKFEVEVLGNELTKGQKFQLTIPAETWFAAEIKTENGFCLIGCTVAPGFHYNDFEMAKRTELTTKFPQHKQIIEKLTRD